MSTRGQGCVSAGLRPGTPGRPRLDRSVSTGPSQGQGRSGTRFLLATSGLARPFVFRTCSKGYSDLCMMPVSASLIQSVRAPNHGPVSDANSCSDGDPCARSSGTSLHGEETGRLLANRAAGHTDPGPKAAFRPNQTRRPQTLPRLRHQRYQPSRPPIYTTLTLQVTSSHLVRGGRRCGHK